MEKIKRSTEIGNGFFLTNASVLAFLVVPFQHEITFPKGVCLADIMAFKQQDNILKVAWWEGDNSTIIIC